MTLLISKKMRDTFVGLIVACFFLNLITVCYGAENLIKNYDMERRFLSPWQWNISGGAKAAGKLTYASKRTGQQSFVISNASLRKPHVFGLLSQNLTVEPETVYRLSLWCKGIDVSGAWFGGGKGWEVRQALPFGTFDWTEVVLEYTTKKNERSFPFVICVAAKTEKLWVDDIKMLRMGVAGGVKILPSKSVAKLDAAARFYPAP